MIYFILLCLLVSIVFSGLAGVVAWRAVQQNFQLQDRQKEYKRFHTLMLDTLEEDTQFMRTEIIRRLTLDIPETRAINGSIVKFQTRLETIRATLKEYRMLEE